MAHRLGEDLGLYQTRLGIKMERPCFPQPRAHGRSAREPFHGGIDSASRADRLRVRHSYGESIFWKQKRSFRRSGSWIRRNVGWQLPRSGVEFHLGQGRAKSQNTVISERECGTLRERSDFSVGFKR